MKYSIEIYHQGEIIEQRESDAPFPEPLPGEQIYVEAGNPGITEDYGLWWIVRKRRHLFFSEEKQLFTLMLDCEPDPAKGEEWI